MRIRIALASVVAVAVAVGSSAPVSADATSGATWTGTLTYARSAAPANAAAPGDFCGGSAYVTAGVSGSWAEHLSTGTVSFADPAQGASSSIYANVSGTLNSDLTETFPSNAGCAFTTREIKLQMSGISNGQSFNDPNLTATRNADGTMTIAFGSSLYKAITGQETDRHDTYTAPSSTSSWSTTVTVTVPVSGNTVSYDAPLTGPDQLTDRMDGLRPDDFGDGYGSVSIHLTRSGASATPTPTPSATPKPTATASPTATPSPTNSLESRKPLASAPVVKAPTAVTPSGKERVTVTNTSNAPQHVTVDARARSARLASAARSGRARKAVRIGHRTITLPGHARRTERLKLRRAAVRTLKRRHRLAVTLTVEVSAHGRRSRTATRHLVLRYRR